MTTDVVSVEPGWTADQCMALMTDRRVRHLPVVENGALVGTSRSAMSSAPSSIASSS